MNTNIIDYGQYNTTWTSPKTVTKRTTRTKKKFDESGRVISETTIVTEESTTTLADQPWYTYRVTNETDNKIKFG